MNRQEAIIAAILCEAVGLALMLLINRLLPFPADLAVTGLGFVLLMLGPFLLLLNRDK